MEVLLLAIVRFGGAALGLGCFVLLILCLGFNVACERPEDEVDFGWLAALLALFVVGGAAVCVTM